MLLRSARTKWRFSKNGKRGGAIIGMDYDKFPEELVKDNQL